jgi:hypothetical protein
MNENEPRDASPESVDAWADAELRRISQENEEWIDKARAAHNQSVEASLEQLEEMMSQSIEQLRLQAGVPDAVKKSSIERAMQMYTSRREAILRQLQ